MAATLLPLILYENRINRGMIRIRSVVLPERKHLWSGLILSLIAFLPPHLNRRGTHLQWNGPILYISKKIYKQGIIFCKILIFVFKENRCVVRNSGTVFSQNYTATLIVFSCATGLFSFLWASKWRQFKLSPFFIIKINKISTHEISRI